MTNEGITYRVGRVGKRTTKYYYFSTLADAKESAKAHSKYSVSEYKVEAWFNGGYNRTVERYYRGKHSYR